MARGSDPSHPGRIRLDGQKCLEARRRRGLSRMALCDAADPDFPISEATVKRAEKGNPVHLEKAGTLARLLGVTLDSLLPDEAAAALAAPVSTAPAAAPEPQPLSADAVPLVGRRPEISMLEAALERCASGRTSVVVLEGEPGIGKTRLLREVRLRARQRGLLWCEGRAYEGATLPFQLFVDAIAPQVGELASTHREACDRGLLERFAVRGRGPGEEEHALFRTVARTFHHPPRPTVLALDDLQWADGASLDLLEHVTLGAGRADERGEKTPLLVVLALRREEAGPRLATLLERVRREEGTRALPLEPLDDEETFELIGALGVARPAGRLLAAIRDATRGNPLFVREVLDVLRLRGALVERAGFAAPEIGADELELPETLTAAITSRLASLPEETRRVLVRAAFLGGAFDLDLLAAVLEADEDEVLDALEEAVRAGFLENRGQHFWFAHPLVRHVVHREPIPARRQRIHREIAERLAARAGSGAGGAEVCAIADHLLRAGAVAPTDELLRFGRAALEHAFATFAWEDAARFCEALLLEGERRRALPDAELAELHRRAGLAFHRCWDPAPSLAHYDLAIGAFERAGDRVGRARALNDRGHLQDNLGLVPYGSLGDVAPLEEALSELTDDAPAIQRLRAQVLDTLASLYNTARQTEHAAELAGQALAIGEATGDDELCALVSTSLAWSHLQRLRVDEARARWEQGASFARRAGNRLREGRCLQRLPMVHLALGRLDDAGRVAEEAWRLTEAIPNSGESSLARAIQAALALLDGRLEEAERHARETIGILRRHRYAWAGTIIFPTLASLASLRGDREGAHAALAEMVQPGVVFEDPRPLERAARRYGWLVDAAAGSPHLLREVRAQLETTPSPGAAPGAAERLDLASVTRVAVETELAFALGAPERAAHADALLEHAEAHGIVVAGGWVALVPRLRALAAALRGDPAHAREHLERALDWTSGVPARLERARTCLDGVQILAREGGDRSEARRLLVEARAALARFPEGALPRLAERARRLEKQLT